MKKFLRNDPPSRLEALRPVKECETADLLRFLNFMSALERWYALKCKYERSGTLPEAVNLREERALHVATRSMQSRIYYHDPFDPEGYETRLDQDFLDLFPERLPPMFDGQVFTPTMLLREFERVRKMTLAYVEKARQELEAEKARTAQQNQYHTYTCDF